MHTTLVSAGVVVEGERVLITRRKRGAHLEGLWEFPGGKVEEGEDPRQTLERELREELDIDTKAGDVVDVTFHRYAEKTVLLLFFLAVRTSDRAPRAIDVAEFMWATCDMLDDVAFPPADIPVLAKVRELLGRSP